ncbi:protein STAY-GREEN LIKE, chloroplastic-like isoform X1 [Ananas comosus]|uniref:Protein STAY-GREEN LIKE, chloroplastic-like isoform X1 n=1 Tax=Ananas comosus TaxID=4615 RepID=A0A6P5EVL8_ANACO|nr:protein STAY-GREEN LIKE, chloroplastic-like isoform X1 [Ananas comosus]
MLFSSSQPSPMAARNAVAINLSFAPIPTSSSSPLSSMFRKPMKPMAVVVSCERRDFYGYLAARILGPPSTFEASKLKVEFDGEEMNKQPFCTIPRAYTLTHCDLTANLTLAVSSSISSEQLRIWQSTLQMDDVVAEWKKVKDEMSLHVHCYVSGANRLQDLAAGFRYHIFSKELPLVLKAVIHGDAALFTQHPELMDAKVWVYFHSRSKKYNRIECWGPLKEATQRKFMDQSDDFQSAIVQRTMKFFSPKTILAALVTFLF